MAANCTGPNSQYQSTAECMTACQYIPAGDAGSGNTLQCHYQHATYAGSIGPNPHCWHAGPYGWGVCGDQCGDFCQITANYCTPDGGFTADSGPPYANVSDCTTACAGFAMVGGDSGVAIVDGGFTSMGPASGNTLDCREWHLENALLNGSGSATQQLHCTHVGMTSPVCK